MTSRVRLNLLFVKLIDEASYHFIKLTGIDIGNHCIDRLVNAFGSTKGFHDTTS